MRRTFLGLVPVLASLAAGAGQTVVYESSWKKPGDPIGKEWETNGQVEISPNGRRVLLAHIAQRGATLSLKNLPKHKLVKIECDLILRGSWDGVKHGRTEPDRVELSIGDGRVLMNATFAPVGLPGLDSQTFPFDHDAGETVPSNSGAAEIRSLGYVFTHRPGKKLVGDVTYRIETFLPHQADHLRVRLRGHLNRDTSEDQWVGLDRVVVTVLEEPVKYSDKEWAALTRDLEGEDPMAALLACGKMLGAPDRLAAPPPSLDAGAEMRLKKLLAELGSEKFEVRRAAANELLSSPADLPHLQALHENMEDRKLARSLKKIIDLLAAESGEQNYWNQRLTRLLAPPAPKDNARQELQ